MSFLPSRSATMSFSARCQRHSLLPVLIAAPFPPPLRLWPPVATKGGRWALTIREIEQLRRRGEHLRRQLLRSGELRAALRRRGARWPGVGYREVLHQDMWRGRRRAAVRSSDIRFWGPGRIDRSGSSPRDCGTSAGE